LLAAPAGIAASASKQDVLDIHHLPLGDGHISTTPERGAVMACRMGPGRRGSARHAGPWIHGASWDLTEKPQVKGKLAWPQAQFSIRETAEGRVVSRLIEGNGLPVRTPTGDFPIARDDPAYRYDTNPNSITAQTIALTLPANPLVAARPSCMPMGMIAVALNGVAIFNALDDGGRDAVAHEVQDLCNGHPQARGEYHYHGPSPCLPGETENNKLIGYALDGFGIYSLYDARGTELTDADLDACHGLSSEVEWNGKRVSIYHYVLTREYPYTIGCFKGTPALLPRPEGGRLGAFPGRPPRDRAPF
jgi:YHYH protein